MADTLPAPYAADTRAKGWRFDLDYERIRQSDTWALATPEQRPWLLMIWLTAWEQVPCDSFPTNDELIAARIGMPIDLFHASKSVLLRGWLMANDGRLYHAVLTERVLEMIEKRRKDAERRGRNRAEHRAGHDGVTRDTHATHAGRTTPTPTPTPTERKSSSRTKVRDTVLPEGFAEFWLAYPRRVSKPQAISAWRNLKLDTQALPAVLAGVERDKRSAQWLGNDGQYIPHPATWLRGLRWEDEQVSATTPAPEVQNGFYAPSASAESILRAQGLAA